MDWELACEPRGYRFDSQSGHMPGLWVKSPMGGVRGATTHRCFSPSLSPSLPLSLKTNKQNLKKKKMVYWKYVMHIPIVFSNFILIYLVSSILTNFISLPGNPQWPPHLPLFHYCYPKCQVYTRYSTYIASFSWWPCKIAL